MHCMPQLGNCDMAWLGVLWLTSRSRCSIFYLSEFIMSDTDAVVINCQCGKSIKSKAGWAGRRIKCVSCETVHLVPKQGPPSAASQTPPPATQELATQKRPPLQQKTSNRKHKSKEDIRARQRMGNKLVLYVLAGSVLILLIMLLAVAIFRPSDEDFYRRVVEDGDASAVMSIDDQALLTKVAFEAKDLQARQFAVEKLTDQDSLRNVALTSNHPLLRISAATKVTDQETLARIALEDKEADVRAAAVRQLTDQTTLARVAVHEEDPMIREAASRKVTDPDLMPTAGITPKPKNPNGKTYPPPSEKRSTPPPSIKSARTRSNKSPTRTCWVRSPCIISQCSFDGLPPRRSPIKKC